MDYSTRTPACVYSAPESGERLELEIKIVDAKSPERSAVSTVTVPPSGLIDATLSNRGFTSVTQAPNFAGNLMKIALRDSEVVDIAVDKRGRYLVGYNVGTSAGSTGYAMVARYKNDGSFDKTFADEGVFFINAQAPPCGTSTGTIPPLLKKIIVEKSDDGIRVAYEQSSFHSVIRLKDTGAVDGDWGGRSNSLGLGNNSIPVLATPPNGCSIISTFGMDTLYYDLSTMVLDDNDNMYFGSHGSAQLNIRKINKQGDTFRQTTQFAPTYPVQYSFNFFASQYNSHRVFLVGNEVFSTTVLSRGLGNTAVSGIGVWNWKESGVNLIPGDALKDGAVLFFPTEVPIADFRFAERWTLKQITVTPDSQLWFTGHVSYVDSTPTGSLNFFVYGKTRAFPSLLGVPLVGVPGAAYSVPADDFLSRTLSSPSLSPPSAYQVPSLESRGFYAGLLQSNGGMLMLGTGDDSALPFGQAAIGRVASNDNTSFVSDANFANARDGFNSGDTQVPFTVFSGNAAYLKCGVLLPNGAMLPSGVLLPNGMYLAGGSVKISTLNGIYKSAWFGRFWP